MSKFDDTLLVSISGDILLVGRKKSGEPIDIVNAFKGKEAIDIYESLTKKKDESRTKHPL